MTTYKVSQDSELGRLGLGVIAMFKAGPTYDLSDQPVRFDYDRTSGAIDVSFWDMRESAGRSKHYEKIKTLLNKMEEDVLK